MQGKGEEEEEDSWPSLRGDKCAIRSTTLVHLQEEGEGEEEEDAAPAREALRTEANGAIKKTALRGETEAARAAELERCALCLLVIR